MKKLTMTRVCFLTQLLALALLSCCTTIDEANNDSAGEPVTQQRPEPAVVFPFEEAAVAIPSPASVQLDPKGRLGERFEDSIDFKGTPVCVYALNQNDWTPGPSDLQDNS